MGFNLIKKHSLKSWLHKTQDKALKIPRWILHTGPKYKQQNAKAFCHARCQNWGHNSFNYFLFPMVWKIEGVEGSV